MSSDWQWVNLPGGFQESLVADLCTENVEGADVSRGCIVVQTNAMSSFHVIFSHTSELPTRGTNQPVLRFVVGKRRNSMTAVGFGNPYLKKEPVDFTRSPEALLTEEAEASRTYWFLYDRVVGVAAMGVQAVPQADLCRLLCRFHGGKGFRSEVCEGLRYIVLQSGKKSVSVRVVRICLPPDISIPRFQFDTEAWRGLPWGGNSCVFKPDKTHLQILESVQALLQESSIAPHYGFVEPSHLCLNAYRLLDPLRCSELFPGQSSDEMDWSLCHREMHRRLFPILQSGAWTYWPLRFDRADCTSVTLVPAGSGCAHAIAEWSKEMRRQTTLQNNATSREMLTITFAFEVFPVEGENAVQARRKVSRDITALLEQDWGVMEFRCPEFVCWQTHTQHIPYSVFLQQESCLNSGR